MTSAIAGLSTPNDRADTARARAQKAALFAAAATGTRPPVKSLNNGRNLLRALVWRMRRGAAAHCPRSSKRGLAHGAQLAQLVEHCLKMQVSVVQFRPWAPSCFALRRIAPLKIVCA